MSAHRLAILRDRVDNVRAWARSRIDQCRDVEARFDVRSQSMIEAVTERRALQAVLRAREEPRREVTFRDGRASCRIVETADGVIVEALIDDGAPGDPLGTGNAKVFVVAPDRETARRTVTAMLGVLRSIAELTQSAAESR